MYEIANSALGVVGGHSGGFMDTEKKNKGGRPCVLSIRKVREIRRLAKMGFSVRQIAKMVYLGRSTVHAVMKD